MRTTLLILISFVLFVNLFPASMEKEEILAKELDELIGELFNSDSKENSEVIKLKLLRIGQIGRMSNSRNRTSALLKKMLSKKKLSLVHYYIYLQLAKLSKNNEKFFIKKALETSLNDEARLETLIKLYEYHKKKGDINREILYLEKQAEIRKNFGDNGELKRIFITLGDYYMLENNLIKSLQNFFEARKYSEKIPGTRNGYIYRRIANVFSMLGRNKLSLKYLKKSHDFAIKFGIDSLRMSVFNDFGKVYFSEGDYVAAAYYNDLSLNIAENKNFPEIKLNADFLKARICFNTEKEIEGLSILKAAVDYGIRTESYSNLLPVIYELVRRAVLYGNLEIASFYLQWLDEIYAPHYKGYFFYYFLKATIYEKRGDLKNAREYYEKTLNNLEKFFSRLKNLKHYPYQKEISYVYSTIARFNFKMFDNTNDVRYLRKAIFAGEVKNPYMFRFVSGLSGHYSNISSERKQIENEIIKVQNKLETGNNRHKGKTFYESRINLLKTQLIELDDLLIEMPRNYRRYKISDLNIPAIQKKLSDDTVIIRFLLLEESSYAFLIDRRSVGYKKLEKESYHIKNLTNSLLNPIESYAEGSVDFLRIKYDLKLSQELYNVLLYEILEFQKDKSRLIIIPDNVLFRIPFEALATSFITDRKASDIIFSEYESAKFLIDDYSVEYTLSLFHLMNKKKHRKRAFDITAFGFPIISAEMEESSDPIRIPDPGLELLPSSEKEIQKIRNIWGKRRNRFYTGLDFTKKNFKQRAPLSRIVHLATHFISNDEYPWYSFFLFSPGEENDPIYYVSDMSNLNFNCDLMFLSSCSSSENHLLGEQVINGMTAALYNAGVGSMIASLWPVNEFNTGLIIPFYKGLKNDPGNFNDMAGFMRKIKISLKKKRGRLSNGRLISFSHPLIWANFNLYKFFLKN